MLERLILGGTRIRGRDAEAIRGYIREQLRVTRTDEVEPFRRWADVMTYYQGIHSAPALIRNWLLPATRYATRLSAAWAERLEAVPAPANAAALHELRCDYYRSMERWLRAMGHSLELTLEGNPSAKRHHDAVTGLHARHKEIGVRAEKEMQKLVKRLA